MKLEVGQKLWWVPSRYRSVPQCEVTVTKVGRKWAELNNNYRIDMETMRADGGEYSSPGSCYLSASEYEKVVRFNSTWSQLQNDLCGMRRIPPGVTIEDIAEARRLLNL